MKTFNNVFEETMKGLINESVSAPHTVMYRAYVISDGTPKWIFWQMSDTVPGRDSRYFAAPNKLDWSWESLCATKEELMQRMQEATHDVIGDNIKGEIHIVEFVAGEDTVFTPEAE